MSHLALIPSALWVQELGKGPSGLKGSSGSNLRPQHCFSPLSLQPLGETCSLCIVLPDS